MVWYLVLCIVLYVDTMQKFSIYPPLVPFLMFLNSFRIIRSQLCPVLENSQVVLQSGSMQSPSVTSQSREVPCGKLLIFFSLDALKITCQPPKSMALQFTSTEQGDGYIPYKKTVVCCMTKNYCNFCDTYLHKSYNSIICISPNFCYERGSKPMIIEMLINRGTFYMSM